MAGPPFPYRRINVIGTSGSGKTSFSRRLAELLAIAHIEMDAVFWGPNWNQPSDDEFFAKLRNALEANENWVLDGNYTRTTPIKWTHADCVVWLDLPFLQTVFRVLKRSVVRSFSGDEIWAGTGNRESLWKCFFSRDSVLLWSIQTHASNRVTFQSMMTDPQYEHIEFIRIRSSRVAREFLTKLGDRSSATRSSA